MRIIFEDPDYDDTDHQEDTPEERPKPQPPERLPEGSPEWFAEARRGLFAMEARQHHDRIEDEIMARLEEAEARKDTDFDPYYERSQPWVDFRIPRTQWAEKTWAKRYDPDRPSDRDLAVASVRLGVSVDELDEVVGPGKYPRDELKALRFHNSNWTDPNDGDRASREGTAGGLASGQARKVKSEERRDEIRRLHQEGLTHQQISQATNVSIRTIQRALKE